MKHLFTLFLILSLNITFAQISDFKSIDFSVADNIAKLHEGYELDNLPLLAHNLTYKLTTDVEKFRAIYTWVCTNIKGDSNQHNKVNRNRKKRLSDSLNFAKWNTEYKKIAFKKLLKYKKTMCTGYAYLIKELCFLANIESVIVDGYGRTVDANIEILEMANHSWNAVKLNNKWYLCDATWSSGYMDGNSTFIKDYNDGYFLTDPKLFAKNHLPLDKKWLLNSNTTDLSFTTSPIVYGETFKHKVIPNSPKKLNVTTKKNNNVYFNLKTLNTTNNNVSLVYYIGANEKKLHINNLKTENNLITFNHNFKTKGYHDVHIKIDNDIVATYTIKVIN